MTDTPSYDVGDKVIFTEITFTQDPSGARDNEPSLIAVATGSVNKEHSGTITEVLRPQAFYNIRDDDGADWTVAADQIRRA